jgi:hypothetical protein
MLSAIARIVRPRPASFLASAIVAATAGPALAPLAPQLSQAVSAATVAEEGATVRRDQPPSGWLSMVLDPFDGLRGRLRGAEPPPPPDERLAFGAMTIPRPLVETVVRAARVTSVDPSYLMALADKESSFRTDVRASTSSAEGLFQFIERTWLEMIRDYGAAHGLMVEAASVRTVEDRPVVEDENERVHILELRRDPYIAAIMAAELMKRDARRLARSIGRELGPAERYLAHFLGADDAERFLKSHAEKPEQPASRLFPAAVLSNLALFTRHEGRRRTSVTVAELYEKIAHRIDHRVARYAAVETVTPPVPWPVHVGLAGRD